MRIIFQIGIFSNLILEEITKLESKSSCLLQSRAGTKKEKAGRQNQVHWMQIFAFRDGKVAQFRQICESAALRNA